MKKYHAVRVHMKTGYQDVHFEDYGFAKKFAAMFSAPYSAEVLDTDEPVVTGFYDYSSAVPAPNFATI